MAERLDFYMDICFNIGAYIGVFMGGGVLEKTYTVAQLSEVPPLVLAYVGDAIYEVFVREHLVRNGGRNVNVLHRQSIQYVKAAAQAHLLQELSECLTEEEQNVVRRGRNAHSHTVPKNADVGEYRYATGLEALVGYLYLLGRQERLAELLGHVFQKVGGEDGRADLRTQCSDGSPEGRAADQ